MTRFICCAAALLCAAPATATTLSNEQGHSVSTDPLTLDMTIFDRAGRTVSFRIENVTASDVGATWALNATTAPGYGVVWADVVDIFSNPQPDPWSKPRWYALFGHTITLGGPFHGVSEIRGTLLSYQRDTFYRSISFRTRVEIDGGIYEGLPEPTSSALAIVAAIALVGHRRRRVVRLA